MDRRTGCLQSNVEYLQQLIAKNSQDAQQRLAAANREIAAQKDQLAAANREIAALKDALAELKTRADQAPAAVARTRAHGAARRRARLAGPRRRGAEGEAEVSRAAAAAECDQSLLAMRPRAR